MSRVGKVPVKIQQGVKVEIKDGLVKVEGPKGKLSSSASSRRRRQGRERPGHRHPR